MFWGLDINTGIVDFDDISFLSNEFDILDNIDVLKEDMLQIEFSGDYLIDVGWRPSFDEGGRFIVCLVKNQDWENLIGREETREVAEVRVFIKKFIDLIK